MASTVSIAEDALRQLVLFRVAGRTYGIELGTVREIIPFRGATRLPGAPPLVAGLVNVRGVIITVLDLGVRLGATPAARPGGSVILIEHGARVVGATVDDVLDVRRLADVELTADGRDVAPSGVRTLGRLDGEVIALLDIHGIISEALA